MTECYVQLGPMCWAEPGKFYIWLVSQVLIWGVIGYILFRKRRRIK